MIDGITYTVDDLTENEENVYSSADRGDYLGIVKNGDVTMRMYSVKGDDTENYLYIEMINPNTLPAWIM